MASEDLNYAESRLTCELKICTTEESWFKTEYIILLLSFMLILLNDNILICSTTSTWFLRFFFNSKIMAAKEEKKQKRKTIFLKHSPLDGVGAMFLLERLA